MTRLVADRVAVRVPATSANLGAGFDSLGLALAMRDDAVLEAVAGQSSVEIEGEGAQTLPRDESHLTIRAARIALDYAGASQVGLRLRARNLIPQGRGVGSSAAATIMGLVAARALLEESVAQPGQVLDDAAIISLAGEIEGHPDNVAPALLGGLCIAWVDDVDGHQAVRVGLADSVRPTIFVPTWQLATVKARNALPASVTYPQATFNLARSALLIHALGAGAGELYLTATDDQLHQRHRRHAMPETIALIEELRGYGLAAVVSGAGPSVLVFGDIPDVVVSDVSQRGWRAHAPGVDRAGARVKVLPRD